MLCKVSPELTEKNWFVKEKKAPLELREFAVRSYFGVEGAASLAPRQPEVKAVQLPVDSRNCEKLLHFGKTLANEILSSGSVEKLAQCRYALSLAGNMGSAEADVWSSIIQYVIFDDYEAALWFLLQAVKKDPGSYLVKHELGHVYSVLGYWKQAVSLIRDAADNEKKDLLLINTAAGNMARLYSEGQLGLPKDPAAAEKYAKKAAAASAAAEKQK